MFNRLNIYHTVKEIITDAALLVKHGAEGIRTPDLLLAKEALSQLSYGPPMDFKF